MISTTFRFEPLTDDEWAARMAQLAVARKRAYERMPKACPACGSGAPFPTFLAPDEWEFASRDCCAVWTVQP
jgi:hypothetical protein